MFSFRNISKYYNNIFNSVKLVRYVSSTNDSIQSQSSKGHKPILYGDESSPPVRFVLMTASILNIHLDFCKIDLFQEENRTEFYKKINPLKKVPALAIDSVIICDSHAIALYLCRQSVNQELYPKDAKTRAQVDEMLFFNSSGLFPTDSAIFTDYFAGKLTAIDKKIQQWHILLDHLDQRLNKNNWLVGDKMFLCDLCCAATVSSLQRLIPAKDRHANIKKWMKNLQELPCFEINSRGLDRLSSFIEKMNYSWKNSQ